MAIAGHISHKMLEHYSHVRVEAKRQALDALTTRRPERSLPRNTKEGYDTNRDTKGREGSEPVFQIIEKNGGDDGTRTRDLCRDRAAF